MILSENEVRELLEKVISENPGKTMSIGVYGSEMGSTRFANNAITTNGVYSRLNIGASVTEGRKRGVAQMSEPSLDRIREAVARAGALARVAPENTELMPILGPQKYTAIPPMFHAGTAAFSPALRAETIVTTIEKAKKGNLSAAGFFETSSGFSGMMNSQGLFYYFPTSRCYYSNTLRGDGCSGWAAADEENVDRLPANEVSDRALAKALASRNPKTVQPGQYTVILEPSAVADMIWFLMFNFAAREADEGRSFLSLGEGRNRLGQKLFDSKVTLYSDPASPDLPALPVGEDGLPLTKTVWVEKGVVKNLFYTRFWADKMKKEPLSFPPNLVMEGGKEKMEDLIRSTRKGILVSRFWYIRDLNPMILLLTGLTRDGIFWIENGRISHPINNFRFNESPVSILKNMAGISNAVRAVGGETGMPALVPALKVENFNFSSISEAI